MPRRTDRQYGIQAGGLHPCLPQPRCSPFAVRSEHFYGDTNKLLRLRDVADEACCADCGVVLLQLPNLGNGSRCLSKRRVLLKDVRCSICSVGCRCSCRAWHPNGCSTSADPGESVIGRLVGQACTFAASCAPEFSTSACLGRFMTLCGPKQRQHLLDKVEQ